MSGIPTIEIREMQRGNMFAEATCGDELLRQRFIGYTLAVADAQAYPDNEIFAQVSADMGEVLATYENQLLQKRRKIHPRKLGEIVVAA